MFNRSLLLKIAVIATVGSPAIALSATYTWRDGTGRRYYGDVCPSGADCRLITKVPGTGTARSTTTTKTTKSTTTTTEPTTTTTSTTTTSPTTTTTSTSPTTTTSTSPTTTTSTSPTTTTTSTSPTTTTATTTTTTTTAPTGSVQLLAQQVARDTDLRNHPDILWYGRVDSLFGAQTDWSWNPALYTGSSWPKVEFVDAAEFGMKAARFESDALSLGTTRGVTGHGPTIMNWRKYLNSNTKEMSSGTALGNVPLNDLYLRYCIMLEKDVWTGMNELGVKLGGLMGRADDRGTNKVAVVFWHAKPDSQGRIRLTTYWFGDDLMQNGYGGDYIQGKYLLPNTWHCLEQHLKVNTVNPDGTPNADAVLEAWVDDELVYSRSNFVIHRYNYNTGTYPLEINQIHAQIYHGGQMTPKTPLHYRITGFALSHKRIGAPKRLSY